MSKTKRDPAANGGEEFAQAARAKSGSVLIEFWDFLRTNKKWWLLPVVLVLLVLGGLIVLSSTAVAPFIYTLF